MKTKHSKELKQKYDQIVLESKVTKKNFINAVNIEETNDKYKKLIVERAKQVAYYSNDNEYENALKSIMNDSQLFEHPSNYVDIYYEQAMNVLKTKNVAKGEKLKEEQTEAFEAFVKKEIAEATNKIEFQGSCHMPFDLRLRLLERKAQCLDELMAKTEHDAQYVDWNYVVKNIFKPKN